MQVSVRWQTADISKPTSQPPATAMAKVQVRPLGLNSGDDLSRRLSWSVPAEYWCLCTQTPLIECALMSVITQS